MNVLPDRIIAIDQNLMKTNTYSRIDPRTQQRIILREKDYDKLIIEHFDLLADTLRQAGIIAEASNLRVLGSQINGIDVLLAEVESTTGEFRRLVLVEDKLFSNPEARREVLAQVLDYALNLDEKIDVDTLIEDLPRHEDWIAANRDRLEEALRTSDHLLLICGDRIQDRLIRLVDRFIGRTDANPLRLTELCLLSLAIYSDANTILLVPNVVGAVTGAQRTITIRVDVRDPMGKPADAASTLVGEEDGETGRIRPETHTEAEFFTDWASRHGSKLLEDCRTILDTLDHSGIPGLRRRQARSGRPVVYLDETPLGPVNIMGMLGETFHDNLHIVLRRHRDSTLLPAAVTQFRRALLEFRGAEHSPTRVYIPISSLAEDPMILCSAIDLFVASLRGARS